MSKQPSRGEYMKAIADEIHKPFRKTFPRRSVHAAYKDEVWSMDLVDMSEWKAVNDGEKYILTVVDVFTRYAWAKPMKTKSAIDTFAAFIAIVEESGRKPKKLWVDQGAEFYNSVFKKWMATRNQAVPDSAVMYSTFGESKSVIVERFNRTLKTRMWYEFTKENTRRWVDMLPDLLKWYNTRVHSKLKMSPMEASKRKNQTKVDEIMNPVNEDQSGIKRKTKYEVGEVVRISRVKGIFEKGYLPNYSREVFTIVESQVPYNSDEPIVYKLKDRSGKVLTGSFYEQELGKVKYPDILLVEKVLKTKKIDGKPHSLVKWLGYPESMNSWLPNSDIIDFMDKPKYAVESVSSTKIRLKKI
jgi:transposase InsO family protein